MRFLSWRLQSFLGILGDWFQDSGYTRICLYSNPVVSSAELTYMKSQPSYMQILHPRNIVFSVLILFKKSACKWTHAIQACLFKGQLYICFKIIIDSAKCLSKKLLPVSTPTNPFHNSLISAKYFQSLIFQYDRQKMVFYYLICNTLISCELEHFVIWLLVICISSVNWSSLFRSLWVTRFVNF